MRILITYYSRTGNTEKIAYAFKDGLVGHEVVLSPVVKTDPNSLSSYDLLFIGSGIYAFNISRKLTSFIKKASTLPKNIALFYTHQSLKPWPNAFKSVNNIIEDQNSKILGSFDCCGDNLVDNAQEQREAMYNKMKPKEIEEAEDIYLTYVKGHPDEGDLENAKKFAQEILKEV